MKSMEHLALEIMFSEIRERLLKDPKLALEKIDSYLATLKEIEESRSGQQER